MGRNNRKNVFIASENEKCLHSASNMPMKTVTIEVLV